MAINLLPFLDMAMIALFRRLAHGSLRGSLPPREVANENAVPNQKPCCLLAAFNGGGRNLPECPPPTGRDLAQYDAGCGFGVAHNYAEHNVGGDPIQQGTPRSHHSIGRV